MIKKIYLFILLFYVLLTFYCTVKMVMCAVATCSTRSGRDNVSMFHFPNDPKLRKAWVFKCRRKNYKPSKHARICEYHFADSDFVISRSFAASVGFKEKFNLQLKPDAIPSLIPEMKSTSTPSRKKKKSPRKPKAVAKRIRIKVNKSKMVSAGLCPVLN